MSHTSEDDSQPNKKTAKSNAEYMREYQRKNKILKIKSRPKTARERSANFHLKKKMARLSQQRILWCKAHLPLTSHFVQRMGRIQEKCLVKEDASHSVKSMNICPEDGSAKCIVKEEVFIKDEVDSECKLTYIDERNRVKINIEEDLDFPNHSENKDTDEMDGIRDKCLIKEEVIIKEEELDFDECGLTQKEETNP